MHLRQPLPYLAHTDNLYNLDIFVENVTWLLRNKQRPFAEAERINIVEQLKINFEHRMELAEKHKEVDLLNFFSSQYQTLIRNLGVGLVVVTSITSQGSAIELVDNSNHLMGKHVLMSYEKKDSKRKQNLELSNIHKKAKTKDDNVTQAVSSYNSSRLYQPVNQKNNDQSYMFVNYSKSFSK